MTSRFWLLFSIIIGLILAGLSTRQGELLALALPLLIYLGFGIFLAPGEIRLEIDRTMSADRIPYGTPLEAQVQMQNYGQRLEEVELEEEVAPRLDRDSGEDRKLLFLPQGYVTALQYSAHGQRGKYQFTGVRATARDPFALFQETQLLDSHATVFIFPEVIPIGKIAIRPRRTHGFAGPIPARRSGSGSDFFGVREYQLGDLQRHINWKRVARYEAELFTNEFERESIADVGIILDARERTNAHIHDEALFEYSVKAAASLAGLFLDEGHPVGLLVYGAYLERVFPGHGEVQKSRILRALAQAHTGRNFALESLSRLPIRFFPPRSQILLVSPLLPADLNALAQLQAQGYSILIASPNMLSLEASDQQPGAILEMSSRLAQAERSLLLHKVRKMGIRTIDWPVDQPFDTVVRIELAKQPLHRPRMDSVR